MPDLSIPSRDLSLLHPVFRGSVAAILADLLSDGLTFAVFEAYRGPERQAWLYGQGRTRSGPVVTRARPWASYHQFGLAADLVLREAGRWTWRPGPEWDRLHEIGRRYGLEALSFEQPHLQMAGLKLADLRAGKLPPGDDPAYRANLAAAARLPGVGLAALA